MPTPQLNRKQLIAAVGGDALVARFLESVQQDVADNLPAQAAAALAAANAARAVADKAQTNAEALALGVLGRRSPAPLDVRPGSLIAVIRDAGGHIVGIDMAQLAVAVGMLAPKPRPATPADDAQYILASRTFNRK